MTEQQIRHARALLAQPENTITSIAKLLGVPRTTLYKYVPELVAGRDALVARDSRPALPQPRVERRGPTAFTSSAGQQGRESVNQRNRRLDVPSRSWLWFADAHL
jgi:transposase-like protein